MDTMPFGRHRGRPLSEIPADYLAWLCTLDLREPLRSAVAEEVARRSGTGPDPRVVEDLIAAGSERSHGEYILTSAATMMRCSPFAPLPIGSSVTPRVCGASRHELDGCRRSCRCEHDRCRHPMGDVRARADRH